MEGVCRTLGHQGGTDSVDLAEDTVLPHSLAGRLLDFQALAPLRARERKKQCHRLAFLERNVEIL